MGVAMGYTLTQPWWITLIVFSALGFGLALSMLAFAIWPQLSSYLPRPGNWMIRLKQFLAFDPSDSDLAALGSCPPNILGYLGVDSRRTALVGVWYLVDQRWGTNF